MTPMPDRARTNRFSLPPALRPLLDPRALLGTVVVHAVLGVLVVTFAAVGARLVEPARERSHPLRAELGPVDNRALDDGAGGSPGESGGDGEAATVRLEPAASDTGPAAELPSPIVVIEPAPGEAAEPGPRTQGQGPGQGEGGPGTGGGSGGGAAGGQGSGRGRIARTTFFGAREQGESFAYVIDVSGSMADHQAFDLARQELIQSLEQLPSTARVAVILYNRDPQVLPDAAGHPGLMPVTAANRRALRARLDAVQPDGSTRPRPALAAALDLNPEALFLLTDGQELSFGDVDALLARHGASRIHAVEFGGGLLPGGRPDPADNPLRRLARGARGSYRRVDVRALQSLATPRPPDRGAGPPSPDRADRPAPASGASEMPRPPSGFLDPGV